MSTWASSAGSPPGEAGPGPRQEQHSRVEAAGGLLRGPGLIMIFPNTPPLIVHPLSLPSSVLLLTAEICRGHEYNSQRVL